MTTDKSQPIHDDGDQPVTQAEFTRTMTALKADLDQVATKQDLESLATKTELKEVKTQMAKLQQTTEQILELIQGIDQKIKPLLDLPERMERVERAIFP